MTFATKRSVCASSTLKTVYLEYCSSLLVTWMVIFWFKNLIAYERLLIKDNLFLLVVYAHEMPLHLCCIFCSRSKVRLSAAFGVQTTPHFVSHNLNVHVKWHSCDVEHECRINSSVECSFQCTSLNENGIGSRPDSFFLWFMLRSRCSPFFYTVEVPGFVIIN